MNWYAALLIILVLGGLSVVYSSYEYRHPAPKVTSVQPSVGTTWHAGLSVDVCGANMPLSTGTPTPTKASFSTTGNGVITIAPKAKVDAGAHATFGAFLDNYPALKVTATSLTLTTDGKATTYKNGQTCAKGTKDAGKPGTLLVDTWASILQNKTGTPVSGNPSSIKWATDEYIAVGFDPSGTKLQKTGTIVSALLQSTTSTSSTVPVVSTSSTVPVSIVPSGTTKTTTTSKKS
jgi:hypothetical protein